MNPFNKQQAIGTKQFAWVTKKPNLDEIKSFTQYKIWRGELQETGRISLGETGLTMSPFPRVASACLPVCMYHLVIITGINVQKTSIAESIPDRLHIYKIYLGNGQR